MSVAESSLKTALKFVEAASQELAGQLLARAMLALCGRAYLCTSSTRELALPLLAFVLLGKPCDATTPSPTPVPDCGSTTIGATASGGNVYLEICAASNANVEFGYRTSGSSDAYSSLGGAYDSGTGMWTSDPLAMG